MGIIGATKSSNFGNVKLVSVLNNFGIDCIVINTSQIPTPRSIDWPTPSSNSLAYWQWTCEMSWPQQLHMQKHIAFAYPCSQIIAPRSQHHLRKRS
jgi:hypothetical protein